MGSVGIRSCDIIDIRRGDRGSDLADEIRTSLNPAKGQERHLPSSVLYRGRNPETYEGLHSDDSHLTSPGFALLEQHAGSIASAIPQNSQFIELSGGYG